MSNYSSIIEGASPQRSYPTNSAYDSKQVQLYIGECKVTGFCSSSAKRWLEHTIFEHGEFLHVKLSASDPLCKRLKGLVGKVDDVSLSYEGDRVINASGSFKIVSWTLIVDDTVPTVSVTLERVKNES